MEGFCTLHPYSNTSCMQNTRLLTFQRSVKVFFQMLFWVPVAGFSLLLIYNTLPYFSFNKDFPFIEERSFLFQSSFYNTCFYIHIAAGALCIGTALVQFSRYILKKSKAIHRLSEILLEKHKGKVPDTFEDLEHLPGVGHKTASVIMTQVFGKPAFPVDTHIHRLMHRWKLSKGKSVEQTERDAKRLFPENLWNKLHLQIIYFGREYCPARGHIEERCPICSKI